MQIRNFLMTVLLGVALLNYLTAQNIGDTVRVKTFHYKSNTRDTIAHFPATNISFEKIIMRYNMRCKNGWVSDGSNRSKGCGEWDYSCNTFIVDSSKIESAKTSAPKYIISNFSGSTFSYANKPIYDYYDFTQNKISILSKNGVSTYIVGNGSDKLTNFFQTNQKSGKSQILYYAYELKAAGMVAGKIDGFSLNALNPGTAHFFSVKIKQVSKSGLNPNSPELLGFIQVYNDVFSFVKGDNEIVFENPFSWDGISNLLVEISFTNSQPSTPVIFSGFSDTAFNALNAINNSALDLSNNAHVMIDATKFGSIGSQMTIDFWAYGDPKSLPANTSIIYATPSNGNDRMLNIHLPWSDGSIYFDCGNSAGAFDRINKVAATNEQKGKWNHWVFTKNAGLGLMNIYLNGNLWLSGTGKTKSMSFVTMILGKDKDLNNNYKGKINELSIWDKALTLSDVQAYVYRSIDTLHPQYSHLLAYLPMNEGSGQVVRDAKFGIVSKGESLQWTSERGDKIIHGFQSLKQRPNIKFFAGNYSKSVVFVLVRDSIMHNRNTIKQYSIVSKAATLPITHDLVKLDTTYYAWDASSSAIYNGDADTVKGSYTNVVEGKIDLMQLEYFMRFPFYNEIMSFVTPYGINLDLGLTGKNWYYDVTDFAPILKGDKRIVMTMGGQYQENMDVEFLFIVGTPPRNVIAFDQLWQGGARLGGAGIGSIRNNSVFAPITFNIDPNGKQFKMRSTITGHGSDGEFEQNGGPIYHSLLVDAAEVSRWKIVVDCSVNPMVAQGGTWLIPRQGWCPGLKSWLQETDLSTQLKPGKSQIIDYEISEPTKTGDFRYITAHQLVTYAAPNFNLDARMVEIKAPTDNFEFAKQNPACSQPLVVVQNTGKTPVKNITFEFWANNSNTKQSYTWVGNLKFMDTAGIALPSFSLWDHGMLPANNRFNVEIKYVNQMVDEYAFNNKMSSAVPIPEVVPGNFKIEIKTNNNPQENQLILYDVAGNVVMNNSFNTANKIYTYPLSLNGCYKLVVIDSGIDGLYWWANTAQGTGALRLRDGNNKVIKTFNLDFGSYTEYNFTTNFALNTASLTLAEAINLYPNPSDGKFILEGQALQGTSVEVLNLMGQTVLSVKVMSESKLEFNTSNWKAGVYFVDLKNGEKRGLKKLIVH